MTTEQMRELEGAVNEKIRAGIPMYPTLYSGVDDPALSSVSYSCTVGRNNLSLGEFGHVCRL